MKKYVTKPIVIEAIQWTGENIVEIVNFCDKAYHNGSELKISTLEGVMNASEGDFIIRGIEGEFYPCKQDIFLKSYDEFNVVEFHQFPNNQFAHKQMPVKSLGNTDSNGAKKNVKDIQFFGDGDTFKLISKASSENEGWMKSTKAMEIDGVGCVVQTTTQQRNPDGSYALTDAVTFVPNIKIIYATNENNEVVSRKLISNHKNNPI